MSFEIEYSPEASHDLSFLRKFDQATVMDAVDDRLRDEPMRITRHRKPMRSNLISTWELSIGDFRAYYDVGRGAELGACKSDRRQSA